MRYNSWLVPRPCCEDRSSVKEKEREKVSKQTMKGIDPSLSLQLVTCRCILTPICWSSRVKRTRFLRYLVTLNMTSSHHSPEFDGFIKTIQFDELCAIATSLRGGTEGGENAIFELIFSDDVTWMARIPLSYSCFQPEELTGSYAATLKFLKTHSSIPVPEVYGYQFHSDPSNKVNASYLLMERLPGHPLPVLEQKSLTADPDPKELALANKVHEQLTDFILQLASFKFDGIGSLREDPNGDFFVAPFVDSTGTAFPKHKVVIYEKLDFSQRGPFHSTSEWYRAVAQLNRQFSLTNPEEEARAEAVGDHELLSEFSDRVVLKEYDHGPFVIHHNDLTVQNILVGTVNIQNQIPLSHPCTIYPGRPRLQHNWHPGFPGNHRPPHIPLRHAVPLL